MRIRLSRRRRPSEEELAARVRTLPRDITPPSDLWDAIAPRLKGAVPAPVTAPTRRSSAWGLRAGALRAPFAPPRSWWGIRPAVAAALALGVAGVLWLRLAGRADWRIARASGTYTYAAGRLTTDPAGRVRLEVGRIGEVEIAPDSRIRLLSARPDHRLALDRGAIAARISAPPRLFYVEMPSATAVDLGCAYTLTVDARGGSLIRVTVGWVELNGDGATSVVPFDMSAYTRAGFRPGTPFADRASSALKVALYRFDFERGGASAVAAVLRSATVNDAVTLWHLLERTAGPTRLAVYRRLAVLAPPPAGVTAARVMALDRRALRTWWDALPGSPGTLPWWQRAAVRVAAWLGLY
jgi:hypothetical protein